MSTIRHVWQLSDGDCLIYLVDGSGVVATDPLLTYCFLEDVTIAGVAPSKRVPATGRAAKKILLDAYEFEMTVGIMYLSKDIELDLTHIFNRQQRLQLVFALADLAYSGVSPQQNDTHTLGTAVADKWQITGRDNDVIKLSATFLAETFS